MTSKKTAVKFIQKQAKVTIVKKTAQVKNKEILSVKDFQEKYFGDFIKKDNTSNDTKKLLFSGI